MTIVTCFIRRFQEDFIVVASALAGASLLYLVLLILYLIIGQYTGILAPTRFPPWSWPILVVALLFFSVGVYTQQSKTRKAEENGSE